jgi:hypothetical protein
VLTRTGEERIIAVVSTLDINGLTELEYRAEGCSHVEMKPEPTSTRPGRGKDF